MTTTQQTRPREAVCPDWCAGHENQFQGWEQFDCGPVRNHSSQARKEIRSTLAHPGWQTEDHASVEVMKLETPGAMTSAAVCLIVGDGSVDLTPDQAREYIAMVLDAIKIAEGQQ